MNPRHLAPSYASRKVFSIEIGVFVADQLGLDLPAIAKKLNDPKHGKWLKEQVGIDKVQDGKLASGTTKAHEGVNSGKQRQHLIPHIGHDQKFDIAHDSF